VNDVIERVDDGVTKCFESRAHELHDEPPIIAVADERRTAVTLAVDESVGRRDAAKWISPPNRGNEMTAPPVGVERGIGVAVDQPKRDLGRRTPERSPNRLAPVILDAHRARVLCGPATDVASIHPRMAKLPPPCALGGDYREIVGRS
jgi:hypothetical protein